MVVVGVVEIQSFSNNFQAKRVHVDALTTVFLLLEGKMMDNKHKYSTCNREKNGCSDFACSAGEIKILPVINFPTAHEAISLPCLCLVTKDSRSRKRSLKNTHNRAN